MTSATPDKLAYQVQLDAQDNVDHKEEREVKVYPEHAVMMAHQDKRVKKEILAHQEDQAEQDHQVPKVMEV